MRFPIITSQAIPAKSGVVLLARLVGYKRAPITQATLTSITYTLTDVTTGTVVASNQPLTVNQVIYDSLQVDDPAWTRDDANHPGVDGSFGYNFRTVIPAAYVPTHGDAYLVEVRFTPVSGEAFTVQFRFPTLTGYL